MAVEHSSRRVIKADQVRSSESIAPLFDFLLGVNERVELRKSLMGESRSIPDRFAVLVALCRSRIHQTHVGLFLMERGFRCPHLVSIDLKKTVDAVRVLEALVRLTLDEVILSVDDRVLEQMRKDRDVLLRRIDGGKVVFIIAAASRFYLRLFCLTKNSSLRRQIFAALRKIKICSPYLLDIVDQPAFETATALMLRAATDHDVVKARMALDVLLGDGPLARTDRD